MEDTYLIQCPNCGANAKYRLNCSYCETKFYTEDDINEYINEVNKLPFLNPSQESELGVKVQRMNIALKIEEIDRKYEDIKAIEDGMEAREQFFYNSLRFAKNATNGFENCGLDLFELIKSANDGLDYAIDRYNPEKGYRFTTYAHPIMVAYIMRSIFKNAGTVPEFQNFKLKAIKNKIDFDEKTNRIINDVLPKTKKLEYFIKREELAFFCGINIKELDLLLTKLNAEDLKKIT